MFEMSLLQLFLSLMLAESGISLMTQNVSDKQCNDRQMELFSRQQYLSSSDSEGGYHLNVKEKLSSVASSKASSSTDGNQMMEYQSKSH